MSTSRVINGVGNIDFAPQVEIIEGIVNADDWKWDDALDGLIATPKSHVLLHNSNKCQIVLVEIEPKITEPEHTHKDHSLFIIAQPTKITLTQMGETIEISGNRPNIQWMGSEGIHYVTNHDPQKYWRAIRVFLPDRKPWHIYDYKDILKWKEVNYFVQQLAKSDQTKKFDAKKLLSLQL